MSQTKSAAQMRAIAIENNQHIGSVMEKIEAAAKQGNMKLTIPLPKQSGAIMSILTELGYRAYAGDDGGEKYLYIDWNK